MASRGRSTDWQREAAAQRRAAEQAAKQAAREAEQHHKAQVRAYEQSRAERAAALTAASEERVRELNGLLAASLSSPPRPLDFETMKKRPSARPLDMGADAEPISAPVWGNFEPPPAGALSRLFGGDRRYARDHAAAEVAFADAVDQHKSAEIARQQRVVSARRAHAELQASDRAAAAQKNAEVDAFADAVRARDRHAASEYFQLVIDAVADPDGFPSGRVAGYVPESTLLAVEWQLPAPDVVPPEKVVRWVKARDEFTRTARPPTEVRQTYQRLVAQLALRALTCTGRCSTRAPRAES
jgi:restriction system protein